MMTRKELATYAIAKAMEFRDRLESVEIANLPSPGIARANPHAMRDIGNMHGQLSAYLDMAYLAAGVPDKERDSFELPGRIQAMAD